MKKGWRPKPAGQLIKSVINPLREKTEDVSGIIQGISSIKLLCGLL
jgi:hypothetical protein